MNYHKTIIRFLSICAMLMASLYAPAAYGAPICSIECPAPITIDSCDTGEVVNFDVTATDGCDILTVVCTPPSGSTFPLGTTPVTCTATDDAGNATSCSFTVTVNGDTTPPTVTCPADITTGTTSCDTGEVVNFDVTATDDCSDPTPDCTLPSGSTFPVGTTPVTCTATDNAGNEASCSFNVNVNCLNPICRTAGFWSTHAGTECPKKNPDCGSQNITQMVIDDACGGCISVCGEVIQNTTLKDADSAVEAMCAAVKGDIKSQLVRQLTALSLNCCISGSGSDCAGDPDLAEIFANCNESCVEDYYDTTDGVPPIGECIPIINCINNGGIPLQSDGKISCEEPLEDSCAFQPLCNETLGLCFDGNQEKTAGSSNACNAAIKSACGVIPPGEAECDTGTIEEEPEDCCGNGIVSGSEECDEGEANGTDVSCCTEDCKFKAPGTECRPADGICDAAEYCDGNSATCPDDAFNTGDECRPADGPCDQPEYCDGGSKDCPADSFNTGNECRPPFGDCDEPEYCDGSGKDCPADNFNTGNECRPPFGDCDEPEYCDGSGPECPPDQFNTGNECRPASDSDPCDVAEYCDGSSPDCPLDVPPDVCGDGLCCPPEDDFSCPDDCGTCAAPGVECGFDQAPAGCWCDCSCLEEGDCCPDADFVCNLEEECPFIGD